MKIELEKTTSGWKADLLDLPGSPPIGLGETKEEAVANLFYKILFPQSTVKWVTFISFQNLEIIEK